MGVRMRAFFFLFIFGSQFIRQNSLATAPKIYYTWMMHVLFKAKLTPNKISNTKIKMSHLKANTIHNLLNTQRCTFSKRTAR